MTFLSDRNRRLPVHVPALDQALVPSLACTTVTSLDHTLKSSCIS